MSDHLTAGGKGSSRRKRKSRAQEKDSDDEVWDSEDDDDTIARIQRAHFAQAAANSRKRPPARPQRMSHKRKMEAVKNFHDFTKKLKKDTGISIRSLVGNNILELSEFSSEDSNTDSDGLSEEGEFVVNPSAVQELNEENESYIDPKTGDIVQGKEPPQLVAEPLKSPPQPENTAPPPQTLSISDIINEDLDLSKNVEIAEVEESELCPEKEELLRIKEEDVSQDFDMKKLKEMDDIIVKPVDKTEAEDGTVNNEENKMETDEEKKPVNTNALNVRRNIREVMDEKNLDASTLTAQRQESERLARVQEQQRIIREVQRQIAINRQNKIHQKTLSLLQGGSSILKKSSTGQKLNLPNTVLVKLPSGDAKKTMMKQGQVEVTKVMKPGPSALKDKKEVVEIVDSSSGEESSSSSSDSDDCIMLSDSEVPPSPEVEEDPNNSGLHVNDTYNTPDEQGRVLINIGHPESEEDIFLAPQIARVIKPHQIGGVRFLFDNIIESVERFSTSTGFGCILAHSMGLGKTLQIVCFCDIFLRHTNSKTVLCIMPINTLQNWVAEFNMWLPMEPSCSPLAVHGEVRARTFPIYVLNDSHKTLLMRAKVVKDWKSTGGVLMIGYELYRLLCMKKDKKPRKKKNAKLDAEKEKEKEDKKSDKPDNGNEETQGSDIKRPEECKTEKEDGDSLGRVDAELKDDKKEDAPNDEDKKLLDEMYEALVRPGPDLVICDEGHRIKNSHSNISYALKQMRTKRRIVLTGYPLQNNLLEYWCMVDFVRPNYLGSKTEFCNMFERPIQNGQCIDSTPQDIRLMRYRAHVLHSLLVGFVQRRSHAVLQSTLPQKEEYVLLVRLTPLQRKLYDRFMNEVVRSTSVPNPLKAFAICCKIWNHPDVLYNFLRKRSEVNAAIEEDLDLEEIGGVTKSGRPRTSKTPGRKPGKPRGSTKKPAATIPPNASGPKAPHLDPRAFGNAPFPPNGPYGAQTNAYRSDQTNRRYPPYPPYQGTGSGYYPPNQGFNQQFDNSYYPQPQPHGNNYPNQYPSSNSENNQGYNHNYWGGGSYYSNTDYFGSPQQYGSNPPPADFRGTPQQFSNNGPSSNAIMNPQQFGNNQSQSELRGNSQQPYLGNQPPDFRNNPQQCESNQTNADLVRKPQQYPSNQPRPNLRVNSQQYPSNQQSPDLRGNHQHYNNNQAPVDFRGNPQSYANNSPSDLRTTSQEYPNSQPSPDMRLNQQQYGNSHQASDIKSNPPYANNQSLSDVRGSQQIYANNTLSDLRGNPQQYSNNTNQDFRENSHYTNNPPPSDIQNSSQHYVDPLTSDLRTNSEQYSNNQPLSDSRIDQNHFPNSLGGSEFRSTPQQYQGRQTSELVENSQQYTSNQAQPDFRSNPQAYQNNDPSSDLIKSNTSETYNNPQQYSTSYNPSQNDQVFAGNSLQPYNSSNPNNYGGNHRPPYHNAQNYIEYNQNAAPTSQYPSNQPSQGYSNQAYPQYSGSSGAFGNTPSPAFNQFGNPSQNYSDYTNQSQASNQAIKPEVNIDPNYQSVEKKCDPSTVPQNPRDLSFNNSAFNYQQPGSSFYSETPGTGMCQYNNYNPPIETKPPLGSANSGSPIPSWPITETLKSEVDKLKTEEKMETKSESDGEVKIEDLDTKKIVKEETKLNNAFEQMSTPRMDTPNATNRKSDIKAFDDSETEQDTPKQGKRRGRPKDSKNKDKSKQKPKLKPKGRKDRKTSKENESESDESEKEEKLNKGEEMALAKRAEEMTYDWATELLKDYIPGIIENSAKMELFFYILNESIKLGDRLLLFSQSLFTLNLIEDFLERNYIPGTNRLWERNTSYYRLDGSTHALEREKLINEFNANPNIYLFLVSTRAGSLGINLVGANRVIVFDASWNPCHDTQAVCRVYRYGQRKPCFVYRFVMDWCLEKKIYDRQINKQGMADRVVDECNPDAVLSMKEITNLCFDNDEKESEPKDLSEHKDKYIDILMQGIITLHGKLLSKEPFQHESLLVDRKEKKLSSAEKRLAQRGYELEKKAALAPKPTGAYRTVRAADGSLVQRPVASVRPMQHGGARWIPADVWRRQGMTAQEMTLPLDVVIPTNSAEKTNIVLKAGQRVMVLKSPKGIYMQLESGKIIAIKTSLKGLQKGVDNKDSPVGKKGTRPLSTNIPGSLKNNSAITITSKTGPRPGFNRLIRPAMLQHKMGRPMLPGQKIADIRNRLGELRSYSPIRVRSPIHSGRLLRPTLPGSVSITRIPRDTKKSDLDSDKGTNKTSSEEDAQVLDSDDEVESGPKEAKPSSSKKEANDESNTSNNVVENIAATNISADNNSANNSIVTDSDTTDKNANLESDSRDIKVTGSIEKGQCDNETQPMILTTDEKLPSEEVLEAKTVDEASDLSIPSQNKLNLESHLSNPAEPIERKINLLKNYRHQRPGTRPQTESSLSQLEKTASALNKEGAPDFRKNLDDITQSYSPGIEDKSNLKTKKKKSPAKPLTPESHSDKLSAPINMSHSVSNLLGTTNSSITRKVDTTLHHMAPQMNSQSILPSHGSSSTMPQDSPISSISQSQGFNVPQNFSTNSASSSVGHSSAMSSSSASPPMDVVKVPAVPSVPPIAIPTPQSAYSNAGVSALSAERPYGQYPGYGMGYGAYPSGWEYGAYGAAPPYYQAYGAHPSHPAHPALPLAPHPALAPHAALPAHPAHPAHPGLPPEGYMPPNPQW